MISSNYGRMTGPEHFAKAEELLAQTADTRDPASVERYTALAREHRKLAEFMLGQAGRIHVSSPTLNEWMRDSWRAVMSGDPLPNRPEMDEL